MNEWLMVGIVAFVAAVAAFGASWLGKAVKSNSKPDKPA